MLFCNDKTKKIYILNFVKSLGAGFEGIKGIFGIVLTAKRVFKDG